MMIDPISSEPIPSKQRISFVLGYWSFWPIYYSKPRVPKIRNSEKVVPMEKDIREEYYEVRKRLRKNMLGFSWKRFLITLGLSMVVWVISGIVQALVGFSNYFTIFHSCSLTGYPIALCISSNDQIKVVLVSGVNIVLWFWVLHFAWNWFEKRGN